MPKSNYIHDFGGKGETLVLLHGFLGSSKYWSKLQPLLTNSGYRVITIDLLGFGNAPKPRNANYHYEDHVNHVHDSIKSLNLHSFVLIGHSMGALVASRYTLTYPENVVSLVLLHPPLYKNSKEAHAILRSTGKRYRFFLDSKLREPGWIIMRNLPFIRIHAHSSRAREKSLKNVIESAEIAGDLENIVVPTALLIGLRDRPEYIENIKRFSPNQSINVLHRNVSHHSPIQEPDLVHDIIISALA